MNAAVAEDRIAEIGRKLDLIVEELALLKRVRSSAEDLVADLTLVARDLFGRAIAASQSLDQKGYFDAAAAGVHVGDALIRAHSADDWRQAEASVPQLVGFVRELSRPEVLQALEAIIHGFGRVQATMEVDKSAFAIVRDLNSPEARRGVAIIVEFLKVVGAHRAAASDSHPLCASSAPER